jgi:hypothetical protein
MGATELDARPSKHLLDAFAASRTAVQGHTHFIDSLIGFMIGHESAKHLRDTPMQMDADLAQVVYAMLQSAGSSAHSLVLLSDKPGLQTRDCYGIARSIVESAVNACYFLAEGPAAAAQALRYTRQKAFRDLQRESAIDASVFRICFSPTPPASSIPGLEADLDEFTWNSGREKSSWTDLSLDDRIARAGRAFGDRVLDRLHIGRFAIYRHSSEILHGSHFGLAFFMGATLPGGPRSARDVIESIGGQHVMILMTVTAVLAAVVDSFNRSYGFPSLAQKSDKVFELLRELPLFSSKASDNVSRSGDDASSVQSPVVETP